MDVEPGFQNILHMHSTPLARAREVYEERTACCQNVEDDKARGLTPAGRATLDDRCRTSTRSL